MANTDSEPPPPPKAAKPAAKADKPAARPAPARSAPPGPQLKLAYRLLKLVAFVVGLPATMLCVMALVGGVTDNGYARVGVAALIATFGGARLVGRASRLGGAHLPLAFEDSATLGAVEDKTQAPATPGHRLVLRGEMTLGGLQIKN